MRRMTLCLMAVAAILLFSTQCKKKTPELTPEQSASDEIMYKLGEQTLRKDPEKARLYMRQVIDSFPKSFYAQRAKLAIANSYFDKGDDASMILAAAEYREFISLYPYSPSAAFAQYRIGLTFFNKTLKPGRDQSKTQQSLAELKKVVSQYPLSEEAKQAQQKIKDAEEKLAAHELSIGRFYYRRKTFKAAISRLTEILTNYPSFSKMVDVYFLLADSYHQSGKSEESIPFFTKLVSDFPESKWAVKAQGRLQDINSRASAPKTQAK